MIESLLKFCSKISRIQKEPRKILFNICNIYVQHMVDWGIYEKNELFSLSFHYIIIVGCIIWK